LNLSAFLITQSLNALSQAALLFFLGVGLTLIFGIMRIVNFAHGTLYMLGAFVGYSVARLTGSFWAALLLAPLAVGLVGMLFEFSILRRLYRRDASAFLMVTFGLALVLGEIIGSPGGRRRCRSRRHRPSPVSSSCSMSRFRPTGCFSSGPGSSSRWRSGNFSTTPGSAS
jgi:branched-subunit amino acid ABC-type transport system permease component